MDTVSSGEMGKIFVRLGKIFISLRISTNILHIVRKYHLNLCRQCFRENAADIGFKKLD